MTQHGASEDTQVIPGGDSAAGGSGPQRQEPGGGGPQRLVVHDNTEHAAQSGEQPDGPWENGAGGTPPPDSGGSPVPTRERSRVRRARLRTVRVDPWSVMKTAFMLSIAFGIMTVVAVAVIWNVLEAAGVYESINATIGDVLGSGADQAFNLYDYIGLRRVLGITALIAVVDVVLITALATLGAFLYNLAASLLGGVELTLAEDE